MSGPPHSLKNAVRNGHVAVVFSAEELLDLDLGEVRWAVPEVLPEGVTILGGKPKMGKSWFALGLSIAVSSGGHALGKIPVEQGDVLYLALEDGKRRLQKRLKKLLAGSDVPKKLTLAVEYPKIGEGCEEEIENWLETHPDARLIVVDTLKKVRSPTSSRRSLYDVDYEALEPLLPLATKYGVSILVVHHLRKAIASDPLDELSSSTGLTAGIDGAVILKRDRGKADAYLHVTGRDIEEERELALAWDGIRADWTLAGDAEEFMRSAERRKILALLSEAKGPMGPKKIAETGNLNYGSIRVILPEMVREGLLVNPGRGQYMLPSPNNPINNVNNNNDSNSLNPVSTSHLDAVVNSEPSPINNAGGDNPLPEQRSGVVNDVNAANRENLTPEQVRMYEGLVAEGMRPDFALAAARGEESE